MDQPFDQIAQTYDLTNDVISIGFHRMWKRALVRQFCIAKKTTPFTRILDVATGTGELADRIKRASPESEVIGLDPSKPMLEVGKKMGRQLDQWVQSASENLPFQSESFDLITCAYGVRNFENRHQAFQEWKRVLKPGGQAFILEIHEPNHWFLKKAWKLAMPALASTTTQRKHYQYLANSTIEFPTPENLTHELAGHGFLSLGKAKLWLNKMIHLSSYQRI